MISSTSLPALSIPPPVRDVRANERVAPANTGRTITAPAAGNATPSALSPRGSILNLSV